MYLPDSPTPMERYAYFTTDRLKFYLISASSTLFLLVGAFLFVRVNPEFFPYTLFFLVSAIYLGFSYFVGFSGRDFCWRGHNKIISKHLCAASQVEVDVFLPVCGEPIELIENTWTHVVNLRSAHEGRLNIYVLDDSHSTFVEDLARKYDFTYIDRGSNELKKAGNLRYAFAITSAPYILILDADFCPSSTFLVNTLPYMLEDERTAIVQTPQFFSISPLQTTVQRGAAAVQELFYRLIQVNRDTFGGAICVGTNALYRRSALEPFGGTAAIPYSEDVRTGFKLLAAGHDIRYIPVILAKGTCPETWRQFFSQQYRWSLGSLSLMLDREFWEAKITKMQRLCYLTGMGYYLSTGMSAAFAFTPSIFLLIFRPEYVHWYNVLWAIPSLAMTNLYMRYWQKVDFTWAAVESRSVSYYAHTFALIDLLRSKTEEWKPSGAQSSDKKSNYTIFQSLIRWHVVIVVLLLTGLSLWRIAEGLPVLNVLPLFALLIYWMASLREILLRIND